MDFTTLNNSRTWTTVDKDGWGDGEWQSEPDKAQWVDANTGYACLIVRGPSGALCGYVGVPQGHAVHKLDYDHGALYDIETHGGLTFSDECQPTDDPSEHVCHIPEPGQPDNVWWFGFDCAHSGDITPKYNAMSTYDRSMFTDGFDTYKTADYVVNCVTGLASQLQKL